MSEFIYIYFQGERKQFLISANLTVKGHIQFKNNPKPPVMREDGEQVAREEKKNTGAANQTFTIGRQRENMRTHDRKIK